MTTVFLDTVGLLALWDVADQWHQAAEAAFQQVVEQRLPVATTTYVLLECGNASARHPYRLEPDQLQQLLSARGDLIVPSELDWQLAWAMYRRAEFGRAGIVDCVSIVVMRRRGWSQVFSNDRHFSAAGLTTLF